MPESDKDKSLHEGYDWGHSWSSQFLVLAPTLPTGPSLKGLEVLKTSKDCVLHAVFLIRNDAGIRNVTCHVTTDDCRMGPSGLHFSCSL